ncbi:MAG: cobyrinate a,c-diamide synthase [Leptolyngbya sp. SIO4C1]|nr:cobyrinate a,c-diamide synthase [Leptolyngbya sp. SIO4C1]
MKFIIAGERSGVGKTTVTLAILAALARRSPVQSFKVGPDYIDPMFHRAITQRPCYSLDPLLTSEAYVRACYRRYAGEHVIIEGVMGLFDGAGSEETASTAHIARLLNLPVLLVVDCRRLSRSIAALVQGYRLFDPRVQIAGVVLNQVGSERHLQMLKAALAAVDMPVLGVLHRQDAIALPDRHLGLVPTGELSDFGAIAAQLAALGQQGFDWQGLERLGGDRAAGAAGAERGAREGPTIAIAWDRAFNFYYADNLALLEANGAALCYWSPMQEALPRADGLYLGGGFPEVFAAALADNQAARAQVRQAITAGMPTYAECGGLMYLCETLTDFDGQAWPMVGALPATVEMTGKLSLGYRQATALRDTPIVAAGETVIGHEFHRSALRQVSAQPVYRAQRYSSPQGVRLEGWRQNNLHASYIHLHWGAAPERAKRFVNACRHYRGNFRV